MGDLLDHSSNGSDDAFDDVSITSQIPSHLGVPVLRDESESECSSDRESSSENGIFEESPHWNSVHNNEMHFLSKEIGRVSGQKEKIEKVGNDTVKLLIKKSKKRDSETSELMQEEKKSKKQKKERDPNHPKQPKNPYLYFSESMRKEIHSKNPTVQGRDLTKLVGQKWKEINDEEKKTYIQMADQDKQRYQEEMKAYNQIAKEKAQAQINIPIPPLTAADIVIPIKHEKEKQNIVSKFFPPKIQSQDNIRTENPHKKKKKVIVKVRRNDQEYYERMKLKERTMEELVQRIRDKFAVTRDVISIINLPNVRVTDTEGVRCLPNDAELVVTFAS